MKGFAIIAALVLGGLTTFYVTHYLERIKEEERKKAKEAYEQQIEQLVQNAFDHGFDAGTLYAKNECQLALDSVARTQYGNGYRQAESDLNIHYSSEIKKIHQQYKDSKLAMQMQYNQLIADTIQHVKKELMYNSKQEINRIMRALTDLYKQEVIYAKTVKHSEKGKLNVRIHPILEVLFYIGGSTLLGAAIVGFWTKRRRRQKIRI